MSAALAGLLQVLKQERALIRYTQHVVNTDRTQDTHFLCALLWSWYHSQEPL